VHYTSLSSLSINFFAMSFLLAHSSLDVSPLVLIVIWYSLAASRFIYSKVSLELSSIAAKLCSASFATVSFSYVDAPGSFLTGKPL
jgi:hypothetical protein